MSYDLTDIAGIGKATAEKMKAAGIDSVEKLANVNTDDLVKLKIKGVGVATAEKYITNAKKLYKEIGKRIAEFRSEQGLSQAQLAEKLNIKQQVLAGYEIANRRLPISLLKQIADILFVKVEDLLGLETKNKPGPLSKLERRVEYIKTLSEKKQEKILEIIDSALEMAK